MADARKTGKLWWLSSGGKAKVSIEYMHGSNGSIEPQGIHSVLIEAPYAAPLKLLRSQDCADYDGPEMIAPSLERMKKIIMEDVVRKALAEIILKNGQSALTLFSENTLLHFYASPVHDVDASIRSRKVDGDACLENRGASTKASRFARLDRSAAHVCRQIAKSVVKSGLCLRARVHLSYAIGIEKPLSLFLETYDTELNGLTVADITKVVMLSFDCRPAAIAASAALRDRRYNEIASDCNLHPKPWEIAKDLSKFRLMNSSEIDIEMMLSDYLARWNSIPHA
jgi:S-adenosylmethionine synthetase